MKTHFATINGFRFSYTVTQIYNWITGDRIRNYTATASDGLHWYTGHGHSRNEAYRDLIRYFR